MKQNETLAAQNNLTKVKLPFQVSDLEFVMEEKARKLMMTSTELDDEKRRNEDLQVSVASWINHHRAFAMLSSNYNWLVINLNGFTSDCDYTNLGILSFGLLHFLYLVC